MVALAGSIASAVVTTFGLPVVQGRRDTRKVLDTYRVPLGAAAYELQARLYNILALSFVDRYLKNDTQGKHDAAIHSTLYVFAQFFGCRELIRGEIQYLRFSRHQRSRRLAQLLVRQSPMTSWPGRSRVAGARVCETSGIVPGGGVAIRASGRRGPAVWAG